MIVQFIEIGSKKLLKELYLTGYIPENDTTIIIDGKRYSIVASEFEANKPIVIIHIRKIRCSR